MNQRLWRSARRRHDEPTPSRYLECNDPPSTLLRRLGYGFACRSRSDAATTARTRVKVVGSPIALLAHPDAGAPRRVAGSHRVDLQAGTLVVRVARAAQKPWRDEAATAMSRTSLLDRRARFRPEELGLVELLRLGLQPAGLRPAGLRPAERRPVGLRLVERRPVGAELRWVGLLREAPRRLALPV
jgi:hypothetical protein